MTVFITFLEGILSFVSPCMLPLLPAYLSFFAAGGREKGSLWRLGAFILGFTVTFVALGLVFSALGQMLGRYGRAVEIVCGAVMVIFGLSRLELFNLPWFHGKGFGGKKVSLLSAFLFGLIYPINLTPCVGAFLGSALALAATSGSAGQGALLLLVYSLGLGLPFLLSGLIMSRLDLLFTRIKQHYTLINRISGGLLILVGLLLITGLFARLVGAFS